MSRLGTPAFHRRIPASLLKSLCLPLAFSTSNNFFIVLIVLDDFPVDSLIEPKVESPLVARNISMQCGDILASGLK